MVAYALQKSLRGELGIEALGALLFYSIQNGLEQIKQSTIYDGCYVITILSQATVSWFMDENFLQILQQPSRRRLLAPPRLPPPTDKQIIVLHTIYNFLSFALYYSIGR